MIILYDYMKPLLQKLPDYIILHNGANDALDNTSKEILNEIIELKTYIQKKLPECKITVSTPIKRHDHGKASLSVSIVGNTNIRAFYLNDGGSNLNNKGLGRLPINLKLKICQL